VPMSNAIKVAEVGEIEDGGAIKVSRIKTGTLDDIAVFNDGGEYYALDDTCSHEQASLSEGWIEDATVECPLHGAKFCLRDGSALTLPATTGVAAHLVEIVGDDVLLTPAEGSLA